MISLTIAEYGYWKSHRKKTTQYVRLKFVILLVLRAKTVSLSCMTMTANQFHIKTDEEKTIHDFLCFYAIRFGNSVEFKLKQHIRTLSRIDVTVFAARTECNRINICWLSWRKYSKRAKKTAHNEERHKALHKHTHTANAAVWFENRRNTQIHRLTYHWCVRHTYVANKFFSRTVCAPKCEHRIL